MSWLDLARSEREDFAAFLETLSPEKWEAPTLCERWNVREVAAHAISFDELRGGSLVRRFLKGWLTVDRINQVGVDDYADRTPEELIALIRTHAERLHLVATDLDWSHGGGPEVQGPGEALLIVMAGRGDALKDLSGPGKDELAQRL